MPKLNITPHVRIHTLLVAWSRVDPIVFALAEQATNIDGVDLRALRWLSAELELFADADQPLDSDLIALAIDLAGQAFVLAEEIELDELAVPDKEINLFFVSMLGLALMEFGGEQWFDVIHTDAAELDVFQWAE